MTSLINNILEFYKSGEYKKYRKHIPKQDFHYDEGYDELLLNTDLLEYMLKCETPLLYENDSFGFNRTIIETPVGFIGKSRFGCDAGNITPNYEYVLSNGFDSILQRINNKLDTCNDEKKAKLYRAMIKSIELCLEFSDRYKKYALEKNNLKLYNALCRIPHKSAQSFYQACLFLKFIQFTLRCDRNVHITFGGFDKYMLPYFENDLKKGVSEEELFETLEEFFITINFDSDIYAGVQNGDNGMSMVLGGRDINGNDRYNRLSELCLKASMELLLIDPKINLRVNKNTPIERFEFATELTKKGLGFPQYSNDDVVIPGLIKMGYEPEDAYEYTVAACWEFIIPGKGYDIPNIDRVNFPHGAERAVKEYLINCKDFESFLNAAKICIEDECRMVAERIVRLCDRKSPYLSVYIDGCIDKGLDIAEGGAKYNNFGAHGVGISTAADIIAAVKKAVFDDKYCSAEELLTALNANFEGYAPLRNYLLACPKMGNNDDYVDAFAEFTMDIFADVFSRYRNWMGGALRPGTGSAMEYIRCGNQVGATPDGRYSGESLGSSFSPSPIAKLNGPLSCIQSFSKYDMTKIINGGPLTMEIHDSTFRNPDGVKKVAALVKAFILRGGHQIQLNAINREVLLDAKKHPEAHKNLIVRVWGWSGYFNELDVKYQDHIIKRTEFVF